jgi:hypothetical protein
MYAGVPVTAPTWVRRAERMVGSSRVAAPGVVRVVGFGGEDGGEAAVGEAEVHDADAVVAVDHDVVGLEVAMDEAGGVGGGDPAGGVLEGAQELGPAAGLGAGPGVEALAGDELHGDPDAVDVGADVVDGDDVGVGELGEGLGLAQEADLAAAAGSGAQELEGDLAVEVGVEGGVDDAHGAGAEAIEEDVAADAEAAREVLGGGDEGVARGAGGALGVAEQGVGGGRGGALGAADGGVVQLVAHRGAARLTRAERWSP